MANKIEEILERFDQLSEVERAGLLEKLIRRQARAQSGEDSQRSVLDGFRERGMIGSITDAPADWSTNPKYMEGFGQHAE